MKRSLLITLTLAMTFVGTLSMKAQTWTGSHVAEGGFLLYNVGSGQYLTAGNGWNTQASIGPESMALSVKLVAIGDKYFICTGVNDPNFGLECLNANDIYTDQSRNKQSTWSFVVVEDGEQVIYNIVSVDKHGGGAGAYLSANSGNTVVAPAADGTSPYAQWKLVGKEEIIAKMATATKQNPVDVSNLIMHRNFATKEVKTLFWNGGPAIGGVRENPCAEKFNTTFDVNQVIEGVPEGSYRLSLQAFYRMGGHGIDPAAGQRSAGTEVINAKLYANLTETAIKSIFDETTCPTGVTVSNGSIAGTYPNSMDDASRAFDQGLYETYVDFTVNDGVIKVGFKKDVAVANDWTIFDNFRLTFFGFDQEALVADYEKLFAQVKEINGDMNATVAQQLSTAIGLDETLDKTSKDDVRAAMKTLGDARDAATASIDIYKKIAADIAAFKKNYSNGDATTMDDKYANGTYETYEEFAADLQNAKLAALGQEDNTDYTGLITNPSPYANLDGWDYNKAPNAFDTNEKCAEYWSWDGSLNSSRFQQTLKDMPAGVYTLTVIALTRTDMDAKIGLNGSAEQIARVSNGEVNSRGQANGWFNAGNGINTVTETLPHGGDLTLWLESSSTGDGWTVWRSFSLSYSTIKDLILVDAGTEKFQATKKAAGQYDDITATITGGGDLAGTKDNLKDGIRIVYENTDALNENLYTAGFKAEAEIDDNAGTVYTVKAREIDGVIKLAQGLFGPNTTYNVTLKPIVYYNFDKFCDDDAAALSAAYGLTLDACDPLPMWSNGNTYTFTVTTNGTVQQDIQSLVKTNTVTARNAWGEDITAELLGIGGTATGINGMNAAANGNAIYNLAGQRVSKTQKGVYVVNGKKVAVK